MRNFGYCDFIALYTKNFLHQYSENHILINHLW
nr:MAG TPA: hypothetical protein [Bacteriophage sp.]